MAKVKYIKLKSTERENLLKLFITPGIRDPLVTKDLEKLLADFQKRFAKISRECNSVLKEFSCLTLEEILWNAAKFIDDRFEILYTTMFELSLDKKYLIWDELRRGSCVQNVILVIKARITFKQIMLLMHDKGLKIPVLLSLYYKLGMYMQAFHDMSLVKPAAAKLALIDKARLGGLSSTKFNEAGILEIKTWAKELSNPGKKRKRLYEEVKAKWIRKYPGKKISVRTIQKYLNL